jgi:pimeloyl-ACP methyl ester carboxylesterase
VSARIKVLRVKRDVVVILPGSMGSRMKYNGKTVWDPEWYQVADRHFDHYMLPYLLCDEDGRPLYPATVPYDDGKGALDTYETLINKLKTRYSSSHDVIFFPYDWRMDIAESAAKLNEALAPYEEARLVAHSMGGLVASKYISMKLVNQSKVKMLVTMGTPYKGSVKMLTALETGKILDGPIENSFMLENVKYMAKNYAPVYQVLPNSRYGYAPIAVEAEFQTNDYRNYGYSEAMAWLKARPWAKKANGAVKGMFLNANAFSQSLMSNGTHAADRVPHRYIVGTGFDSPKTGLYKLSYYSSPNDYLFDVVLVGAGDGTVMLDSAANGGGSYKAFHVKHGDLPKDDAVIKEVFSCLDGSMGGARAYAMRESLALETGSDYPTEAEAEDFDRTSVVVDYAGGIEIYDGEGRLAYEDGESLLIRDIDGSERTVASVWEINPDTGRRQYNFHEYGLTMRLQEMRHRDENLGIVAMKIHNESLTSFWRFEELDAYDRLVIEVEPDGVSLYSEFSAPGEISRELIEPSTVWNETKLEEFNQGR